MQASNEAVRASDCTGVSAAPSTRATRPRRPSARVAWSPRAITKGTGPEPLKVDGFDHVAFGNLNEVRSAITTETAAILVEPIQGEGGIRPGDAAFLKGLREACDEFGLLLFYDEVQTGIGRSGRLFAYEWGT